ncbi:MAG: hypothetical protein ABI691_10400 [Ginsengibacter sp.]
MMKKSVLILLIFFSGFATLYAQEDNDPRGERVQALKIAFITQKLGLTSEEAQKFWPIYNQYDQEVRGVDRRDVMKSDQQLLDIRKKYQTSFEKILGPQRLNKLFNAERDFREVLIRRLKDRQAQRLNSLRR